MPIVRANSKIIYYAHIPKCAGSSVERYLEDRFGALGLYDNYHTHRPETRRWSMTSPQHIDWRNLETIIPKEMIDVCFTVVRHPVNRILSCFFFQRDVEKSISPNVTFSSWLKTLSALRAENPFLYDNHVRPQVDFLPDHCTVFYLEHGLDALVPFLDAVAGSTDGPRAIGHENKGASNRRRSKNTAADKVTPPKPTQGDLALIESLYAEDFERLGYRINEEMPLASKPAIDDDYKSTLDLDRHRRNSYFHRLTASLQRKVKRRLILRQIRADLSDNG